MRIVLALLLTLPSVPRCGAQDITVHVINDDT